MWIYVITELFSLIGRLNISSCTVAWIIYDSIFLVLVLCHLFQIRKRLSFIAREISSKTSYVEYISVVIFAIYGLFICLFAARIVPYNWDSLSYHLGRIWFWAQNESVGHFTTSDTRMLGTPAFKEFIDLHLYLLYGKNNDAILNLTQSVSYLFNILFVYSIARRIGCAFKGGIVASVLFATTPIVFAESLSTQTDEFAALWILVFTRILLELAYCDDKLQLNNRGILRLCILAISLALGIITKPSGLFCVAVLFFWLLYICIKRCDNIGLILKWVLLVITIMIIIVVPESIRNIVTYGSITDPWQGPGQLVLTFDLRYQIVNFFKNIGYFLPGILWPSFNMIWQHMVYYLGYILRIDIDSLIISEGGNYHDNLIYKVENYEYDTATNSVITLLFIAIIVIVVARSLGYIFGRNKKSKNNTIAVNSYPVTFGYSTVAFAALIISCAFIKSEVYVSRYMIASYGLISAAIALQVQKLGDNKSRLYEGVIYGSAGLLICAQFASMIAYHSEHLLSSNERAIEYYEAYNMGEYESVYKVLEAYLEDQVTYNSIGIKMDAGMYAYPLLRLLEDYSDNVYYVDVDNSSSKYQDDTAIPDIIIVISLDEIGDLYSSGYTYNGCSYGQKILLSDRCSVFVR